MAELIGIDPGLSGGIVAIDDEYFAVHEMPVIKNGTKSMIDADALAKILRQYTVKLAVIEKVGAMPGQGVTSMYNFGYGCGIIEGLAASFAVPRVYVRPQEWQKHIFVGIDKSLGKKRGLQYCQQRFPSVQWTEGTADAACIALYGLNQLCSK